ncbi:MAG TPA: hypothetical protein PKL24_09025 [Polyangiaceae bacterium]|nr:hypothetical protein [Polyangiaceae bacterium]HOD25405.1 hypothetical protein [Polyangiaceae bacterium]HPK96125.1 hypothetical protein [Polyangiaceae bacterium]
MSCTGGDVGCVGCGDGPGSVCAGTGADATVAVFTPVIVLLFMGCFGTAGLQAQKTTTASQG